MNLKAKKKAKRKNRKKPIAVLIIMIYIINFLPIPNIATLVDAASFAKNAKTNIDSFLQIITGEQWKQNVQGKPTGTRYSIKHPSNPSLNFEDYMYDMNYYIDVQGYNNKSPMSLKRLDKMMPLLRPIHNGALGRLVFIPSDAEYWALNFNGDKDYVKKIMGKQSIDVLNNTTSKRIARGYIRDIAQWSGAKVDIQGLREFDTGSGNEFSRALITTTSYPDVTLTVPNKAKVNEAIEITYKGREYYPSSEYGVIPYIAWVLKVDGKVIDSSMKSKDSFSLTKSFTFDKEGTYKISLEVVDQVNRKFSATSQISVGNVTPPPPPKDNKPPVAKVSVLPHYYWPETVDISTISYDPDGEIVSEEMFIDGQSITGNQWKSSRVTEKIPHTVYFRNMDDAGETAEDSGGFEIWPTLPTAAVKLEGTLKENRAVVLDAKASDLVSPVDIAPIKYNLTTWKIVPVSDGLKLDDIKIRPSADPSIKQVLFKKAGVYQLQLTVTNIYDEVSEVLVKELDVQPDEAPFSRFTVDKSVHLRDKDAGQTAKITLTDGSVSLDNDTISQRIWYVEFDANNDGVFGTAADGGKQVISNENETTVTYKAKHLGHYRFSLFVKESFGEPTYEEFVLPEDYRSDDSDVIDKDGSVEVYMKPENFNIPTSETAIQISNVPPIIDFGVKRQNSMEVVLDFAGMDVATKQHKSGSRPGGGVNNGGGGGTFNHNYYTIDEQAKNSLSAYAGSLEADLRLKGLDATVNVNNCYYHKLDLDGECVQNIPNWNYVDYGSYTYSSYSGTSPYSGSWEVVSQSSEPIMQVTWCYSKYWFVKPDHPSGNGGYWVEHSHAPPCTDSSSEQWSQVGTNYSASIRQWVPDYRFVITGYSSSGCTYEEQIDTTDFTQGFSDYNFKDVPYKYYFRMDEDPWTWKSNTIKKNLVINKAKNEGIYLWSNSNSSLRTDAQSLINAVGQGTYTQYSSYLQSNIEKLRLELLNKFMIEEDSESFTIVLGDKLDYTTVYEDFENDPELQREWKFVHDPTSVNGRIIDAQPNGPIAQSDLYINSPMQLNEVGTYNVTLRAKDNPLSNTGNDARFSNYRKWSDEEIVREYKINVHRRPIADFIPKVEPGTLKLTLDPSTSYDPDHRDNWSELGIAERGIVEYTWEKYVVDGVEYKGTPPSTLQPFKDYFITLRVKDIDGAYGTVTKHISTKEVNLKPIALFDSPSLVLTDTILNDPNTPNYILDRSYDPNGDPLTNYNWTIKRQSDGALLWSGSNYPKSFQDIGLGTGKYLLGLTVWDIPKYPPALQSDLYEKEITVVHNNPPKSCFELSQGVISPSSILCNDGMVSPYTLLVDTPNIYTDKSSDPDDHPLINYSWDVEKLSETNKVTESWNTGSAPIDFSIFGGIGKYRVTQTVFDQPPAPLPSLSDRISKIYNVIRGPQAPYAMFEYAPLLPIGGDTIQLTDQSWDEDGNVIKWEWVFEAPNGTKTTQTVQNPKITNAQVGKYKVTLNVWDDTLPASLKSKVPAYKEIVVSSPPSNKPPVALFVWEPFEPFLGESFTLDPDASYDLDGEIVSYQWQIRSKEGNITNSSTRYPSIEASSEYYDITLTVRDNDGATANTTQRINVNIAQLIPFVTHTDKWRDYWASIGESPDVNKFLAGEKFVIRLKTTPANRVDGRIDFGGQIGKVNIPSSSFKLISTSKYEYLWETTLWQDDFEKISNGEYAFEFKGYHPVNNPYVESSGIYMIRIEGNIFEALNFHRNF